MLLECLFVWPLDVDLQNQILDKEPGKYDFRIAQKRKLLLGDKEILKDMKNNLMNWKVQEKNGGKVLFFERKMYIPQNQEIQQEIIKEYLILAGHPGEQETYLKVKEDYWWLGLQTFVKNCVKGCSTCQQFKINWHLIKLTLIPSKTGITSILYICHHGCHGWTTSSRR